MKSIFGGAKRITPALALLKPGELKEAPQSISTQRGRRLLVVAGVVALGLGSLSAVSVIDAMADSLPGGTLDPLSINKYVTHLVIPPVMKRSNSDGLTDQTDDYQIAVRQFKQQILPPPLPATTVWSYGPESDPTPTVAPDSHSQFNYPAYTIETTANRRVNVRWINGLVKPDGTFLPHLLPVDQTLHWANPPKDCLHGDPRTDCMGKNQAPYTGPVPMVVHVHGSHVDPHSDGYSEAWWLPAARNIPPTYARSGQLFDDATGMNRGDRGYADFSYRNDQAATTLWYHDHTLGVTRNNVYAGPAGFWLVRSGVYDGGQDVTKHHTRAVLPGPAPAAGQGLLDLNTPGNKVRNAIREIPIVIQGRSFNADGSLFYPSTRAFFEGLDPADLQIPFAPQSDVPPIWNAETFFNVMVVNGRSWPKLEVAQARYRFRLLDGTNARFLNLALFEVNPRTNQIDPTKEIPFYQIGADQGFLPKVVRIKTGEQIALTPGITEPVSNPNPNDPRALLMAPAERVDVIVDFSSLRDGTVVRMINTAPDSPFGGFADVTPADSATTGQVMQFVVKHALTGAVGSTDGTTTPPKNLRLNAEQPLNQPVTTRQVSLNEDSSSVVCVGVDDAENYLLPVKQIPCTELNSVLFGPTAGKLGVVTGSLVSAVGNGLQWADETGASQPVSVKLKSGARMTVNVTETPTRGDIEEWQIYNFTEDAHPIHLHQIRFEIVSRTLLDGTTMSLSGDLPPGEAGFKDMVVAYPGEITTVRTKFDIPGLYVWHCHILEHEDNEMMRPLVVTDVFQPPHRHDFADRDRPGHKKMKHEYRWADKYRVKK
jgi:spore coat protein A, manganese oxidase